RQAECGERSNYATCDIDSPSQGQVRKVREGSLIDRRRDAKAVPPGRPFAFVRAEMVGAARIELATPPV
ncbi:MAG: hypothetical protein CMH44_13030, partial [Muricauda sp.]|nr:hypothetical protein [Allomuricauda sp.]